MTPYIIDNQEQRYHLLFVIFTKTEIFDQSADFFYHNVRVRWKVKIAQIHKKFANLFLHAQASLKRPIFRQIPPQCHSEGIPISYRRLSATKKYPPRPINLPLLQP